MPRRPFRARLGVEPLETRDTPAFLTGAEVVVGADAGSPSLVRLIDPSTQTVQSQFLAFGGSFYGGVRVAVGDVTGDGTPDLVCAAGPSGGPQVQVFDGATGNVAASFLTFSASFTGGVNVAVGDVTGDGTAEIIAGAGAGGGPAVAVFTGGGTPITSFFAYDMGFQGGVRVAAADTTGDGTAEVVTVPGYSGGPDVRIWQILGPQYGLVGSFAGLSPNFYGGSYVAAGDVTGDGVDEIVVGAGTGGGPQVQVFAANGSLLSSYFAYSTSFQGGVRVGVADLTGDGLADVLTAPGSGGAAQINVYDGLSASPTTSLFGFPTNQLTGAFVAGTGTPLNIPSTPTDQVTASYNQLATFQQNNQSIVDVTIINVYGNGFNNGLWFPWGGFGGFGFGFPLGFGPTFYDAPGLYGPVGGYYDQSFFGPGYYGDPGYYPAPLDMFQGGGFGEPGITPELLPSPTPVFDYPVEAVAFGGFPGYGYGDYGGFYDYGGFSDFGGYGDFGGGFSDFGGGFGDFGGFGGGGFFA